MENNKPLILVVEDESVLLQTIIKKLRLEGFETVSCRNTDQCLDYVENLVELPNIIWLDYYLEGSDTAIGLLSKLHEKDGWKDIPTVIVSNTASKDKVKTLLALGAKKYILKAEHRLDDIVNTFKGMLKNGSLN